MVERDLAKVDVAGSTPVSRSRHFQAHSRGSLKKPRPACPAAVLISFATLLVGCGDNRSLQSVSVMPASATSQAQFAPTAIRHPWVDFFRR